jgi:hypothetical protein
VQAGTRRSPRHTTEGRTLFPSGTNEGRPESAGLLLRQVCYRELQGFLCKQICSARARS